MPSDDFRLLIVKTSSLGDVIHNLPVLEDVAAARPDVKIDWLVEEAYVELLGLQPRIDRVIGVGQRSWRTLPKALSQQARAAFTQQLRSRSYQMVLDSQGLLKSAVLARQAKLAPGGQRVGLALGSIREPLARVFYHQAYTIGSSQHAVERLRSLSAQALGYRVEGPPRFGLRVMHAHFEWLPAVPFVTFIHGTARLEKRWPLEDFRSLASRIASPALHVVLPHGGDDEEERAHAIANGSRYIHVAPRVGLPQIAALLQQSRLVVGVDTGLTHLSAALERPTVGLFGATERWRYAPYWSASAISLGGPFQPALAEVIDVCERLLQPEPLNV